MNIWDIPAKHTPDSGDLCYVSFRTYKTLQSDLSQYNGLTLLVVNGPYGRIEIYPHPKVKDDEFFLVKDTLQFNKILYDRDFSNKLEDLIND